MKTAEQHEYKAVLDNLWLIGNRAQRLDWIRYIQADAVLEAARNVNDSHESQGLVELANRIYPTAPAPTLCPSCSQPRPKTV